MKCKFLYFALFAGLCFSNNLSAATFTWTGAVDNNWNTPGNWDVGGFPDDATDDVIIDFGTPQVNVDDTTGDVTINGGNLTINASTTLDIDGNIHIDGTLTFATSTSTCDVSGNWDDVDGTFTPSAGTIILSGNSKTITTT